MADPGAVRRTAAPFDDAADVRAAPPRAPPSAASAKPLRKHETGMAAAVPQEGAK